MPTGLILTREGGKKKRLTNRLLIDDEAKILIEGAYVALDRVEEAKDIDVIRQLLKEADELLAQALLPISSAA